MRQYCNYCRHPLNYLLVPLLMALHHPVVFAEGTAWLPEEGSTSISATLSAQSTDRYFIRTESQDLGGDLTGTFLWLNAKHGITDIVAVDFRTGYARTTFESNPLDQEDFADTSVGVTYQWFNEFELDNGAPTFSTRLGYTFGGDYETALIDAIGDGASGFDLSLLAAKNVHQRVSLFADVGFRSRNNGVPDSFNFNLGANISALPVLGFQLAVAGIRSDGDIDIGDPGFGVDQFPQTRKDSNWIIAGVSFSPVDVFNVGFTVSSVTSGRNVPDSNILSLTVGYSF